ncbi:hypothetical protein CsatB_004586 [Cannabis sativa]
MGRSPCCDGINIGLKKGPWTPEEDKKLIDYIEKNGHHGSWKSLPKLAGLIRCGKSCRLRWNNYLRPDIKRGKFSEDEERIIINLHSALGNKWSRIASHLPGRTDNEIKNFWNTYLRKKLLQMGIDPQTHKPRTDLNHFLNVSHQMLTQSNFITNLIFNNNNNNNPINSLKFLQQPDHHVMAKVQLLQNLMQFINPSSTTIPQNYNSNVILNNTHFQAPKDCYHPGSSSTTTVLPISVNPNSLECTEVGTNIGYDRSDQVHDREKNNSSSSDQPDDDEIFDQLPGLVSELPLLNNNSSTSTNSTSNYDHVENKSDKYYSVKTTSFGGHSSSSPNSTVSEAWEKLMDNDQTNEFYWKDILEYIDVIINKIGQLIISTAEPIKLKFLCRLIRLLGLD